MPLAEKESACSAPSADSCFQPMGNPHYFMVHVQEVLEKLSVVFLAIFH